MADDEREVGAWSGSIEEYGPPPTIAPPQVPPQAPPPETFGYMYGSSRYANEPPVPRPTKAQLAGLPANELTDLPAGGWAYRETVPHHERLMELDRQAALARQAAEAAAQDAQMFAQMSRVAKSTKDIEIARRSIDVMGLQRDIQNGVPIHDAVARHPMALGSGYGAGLRATAPAPVVPAPEELTLPSGAKGVRTGRYGEQFHYAPGSGQSAAELSTVAVPITDPSGNVLAYRGQTGPRSGSMLQRAPTPGSVTQEKRMTVDALKGQLRDVERAIAQNATLAAAPTVKAKIEEWTQQRDELKRKLAELVPGAYSTNRSGVYDPKTGKVKFGP